MAVCLALAAMVQIAPAAAHPGTDRYFIPGHRGPEIIGGTQGHCTHATVHQEHGFHWVSTKATNCAYYKNAAFRQAQHYYKQDLFGNPAVFCFSEGWFESPVQSNFYKYYPYDIWNRCNNGFNVNVRLYIDSWQYSLYNGNWWGNAWAPATSHCHCP
jgi:hypothetical protein